jgi:hypothetical protein
MARIALRGLAILLPVLLLSAAPPPNFEARMLAIHNSERARFGAPPLIWDPVLAQGAAQWVAYLAQTGAFDHSPKSSRPGIGENLAAGDRGAFPVEALVHIWIGERNLFVPGVFPNVSRDGNWFSVSHYTQMVWPSTTRIGCAMASSPREDLLVCRYSPRGNADGRPVGVPPVAG